MKRMTTGFVFCVSLAMAGKAHSSLAVIPCPSKVLESGGWALQTNVSYETDATLPHEAYRLSVRPDGVRIVSSDAAGSFYAEQTFAQLRSEKGVPCVEIEDCPAYAWRGMQIDEARHFFGKETVKRVIDVMAKYKYNVLCWHLSDDQGWRLDVPGYPDLVKYGSVRPQSPLHGAVVRMEDGNVVMDMDGVQYGPHYYTEADLREIIAYALERHIDVVPEIDVPGHVAAALAAYPEFACKPENMAHRHPRCVWGIEEEVLCIGNPKALAFVKDVLGYVAKVFPSRYINVWGDECPTNRWSNCRKCQALMTREGIGDVKGLQPWFTRFVVSHIESLGKRALGGDECLVGEDIPKSLIGLYWRDGADVDGAEGVRRGHDMVMIPLYETYFYFGQKLPKEVDPFQYGFWDGSKELSLADVYRFDPVRGIPKSLRRHVLGGMGCNWSEYTWNEYDLQWKMWPRGCAMSEVLWCGKRKPGFEDFKRRVKSHRTRLVCEGVNCAPFAGM